MRADKVGDYLRCCDLVPYVEKLLYKVLTTNQFHTLVVFCHTEQDTQDTYRHARQSVHSHPFLLPLSTSQWMAQGDDAS